MVNENAKEKLLADIRNEELKAKQNYVWRTELVKGALHRLWELYSIFNQIISTNNRLNKANANVEVATRSLQESYGETIEVKKPGNSQVYQISAKGIETATKKAVAPIATGHVKGIIHIETTNAAKATKAIINIFANEEKNAFKERKEPNAVNKVAVNIPCIFPNIDFCLINECCKGINVLKIRSIIIVNMLESIETI